MYISEYLMINMFDLRLFNNLFSPDAFHTVSHVTMWPYCRGYNTQMDGPQITPSYFRGIQCFWSLRLVLLENSCLQWPTEIGNWALRTRELENKNKENYLYWHFVHENRETGRLFQKRHLVYHFELSDQKLSAKQLYHTPQFILLFLLMLRSVLLSPFFPSHLSIFPCLVENVMN